MHVHQKKGNAKWVKDPARRNSRQVIIFVCLLKVFSSYALLYMYFFMLGNRGKQKYDVRDILGDNILRFKCRGQIRNPWKLTSVAWDSRGVTPWCNSSTIRMSLLLNRGTEVESECSAVQFMKKNHYFKEHRLTDRHTVIGLEKNIFGNSIWCLYYEVSQFYYKTN